MACRDLTRRRRFCTPVGCEEETMLYRGSCHCGKVAFEFKAKLTGVVRCNCSICSRKGALLCAVPHESLTVLAWGDDLSTYTFGNHAIAHRFCRTCGIHPFAEDVHEGRSTQRLHQPQLCRGYRHFRSVDLRLRRSVGLSLSLVPAGTIRCRNPLCYRHQNGIGPKTVTVLGPLPGMAVGGRYSACFGPRRNTTTAASSVAMPQ